MLKTLKETCHDFGSRPGCLGEADPRYTMDFTDIGEGYIYWCAHCGPESHKMAEVLDNALKIRGPEFAKKLGECIDEEMKAQEGCVTNNKC